MRAVAVVVDEATLSGLSSAGEDEEKVVARVKVQDEAHNKLVADMRKERQDLVAEFSEDSDLRSKTLV